MTDRIEAGRYAGMVLTAGLLSAPSAGFTVDLDDISLYVGGSLTVNDYSTIGEGAVVVRGEVIQTGGVFNVESIYGESGFTAISGLQATRGPMYLNNSIQNLRTGIEIIRGDVTSAMGDIGFAPTGGEVVGSLTAAGNVDKPFSLSGLTGNILAGGDVYLEGDVVGDVTYGGSLTQGPLSDISGSVSLGGPISPELFSAPELPNYDPIVAGTNDIYLDTFENIFLTPGTYGSLFFDAGNTVSLSAGTYVFENIVSDFRLNRLDFDTSEGAIEILIAADEVSLDLVQQFNGEILDNGRLPFPDPEQAGLVTLRVGGSLGLENDFYGSILVPDGDITLGFFANVFGRVWGSGDVVIQADINTVITAPGDYSADGFVSQADLDMILLNWGGDDLPGNYSILSQLFDGHVSQNELDHVLLHWGEGIPPNSSAVPEPASLGLMTGMLACGIRRRGQQ